MKKIPEDMLKKGKVAALVIDMQNDYCSEKGALGKVGITFEHIKRMLPEMGSFIELLREKKVPLVFTKMTEAQDSIPKNLIDKKNDSFGDPSEWQMAVSGTWGHEFVFKPAESDIVLEKSTYDSFSNERLGALLKRLGIDTLIVMGVNTNICVDTTVRSAVTKGYNVVLVGNLVSCPDHTQALHEATLRTLGMQFAYVINSKEIETVLKSSGQ